MKKHILKIFEINSVPYGSTCTIMVGIANIGKQNGYHILTSSGYSTHPNSTLPDNHISIGGFWQKIIHIAMSSVSGIHGIYSKFATHELIKSIKKEKADIIHFHNLHGWYINLPMIFNYIKKNDVKVVWTLHDCWAFTGHCPHFTMIKCDKWKDGCYKCPQYKGYPKTYFDRSQKMWGLKRNWFTGVKNLTIVTPSRWLAGLVRQSFLKDYPIKVINNGIDLSAFKPIESDFRTKYSLTDKFVLLGVSFGWNTKKGFDVFIELSQRLDDKYRIVLVGTDDNCDKLLPDNIISIHRTQNQRELAEIYSAADLFVNPTREENYPTVNMESLACGTPVLTFRTGGSPEMLDDSCGTVVDVDDIDALECEIRRICKNKPYSTEVCVEQAKHFDMNARFKEYIDLYEDLYE